MGLLNVQFAVTRDGSVYILEANPRASRTVPFVSKATGVPWAKVAALAMAGHSLESLGVEEVPFESTGGPPGSLRHMSVKACVFPFSKFEGVDTILGPEMKSTGEVMGIHHSFSGAFAKSQFAAGNRLPSGGRAFLSVMDDDKDDLREIAQGLFDLGFELVATSGTATYIKKLGIPVTPVRKVREGSPHIVDLLGQGGIALVNTPEGQGSTLDSRSIRLVANELKVPTYTTIAAAKAAVKALRVLRESELLEVRALQDYYPIKVRQELAVKQEVAA